jgi:trehalose-6-phosphate synthase
MRALRRRVAENDVRQWADDFLDALDSCGGGALDIVDVTPAARRH